MKEVLAGMFFPLLKLPFLDFWNRPSLAAESLCCSGISSARATKPSQNLTIDIREYSRCRPIANQGELRHDAVQLG
jgi:hypothetical protein